jgi:hypothetical protein
MGPALFCGEQASRDQVSAFGYPEPRAFAINSFPLEVLKSP